MNNKENKYNIYRVFNENGVLSSPYKVKKDSDISNIRLN